MVSEIKPIAGMERIRLADAVPLRTPMSVFIFPTTYCNFRCKYCGHSLGTEEMKRQYGFKPEMMSLDTLALILKQLKRFPDKIKKISLTGHGEPMMNPNIIKMVEMVKAASVAERIEMISNGSLLSKSMADGLIDAGLDCLRISIQGITTQKYKEMCESSTTFEQILSNISYFYRQKKATELFIKVLDVALEGKEEEKKFYDIFSSITDRMFIERCCPVYDGVAFTEHIGTTTDRYGRIHTHREVCPLPFFMLGIFPNGDVEPCDTIYKPVLLGNVHTCTLYEMWGSDKLKEFQMMQLKKERSCNPKCRVCCAPDDVSHPEDELDTDAVKIMERFCGNFV